MEAAVVVVVVDVVVAKLEVRVAEKQKSRWQRSTISRSGSEWKHQLVAALGVQGLVFTSSRVRWQQLWKQLPDSGVGA